MITRRSFAKHLLTAPVWATALLSAASAEEGKDPGLEKEITELLRGERLIDTAAGDRFFRHPAEKPLHYHPARILPLAGGGMLGINHLVEEIPVAEAYRMVVEPPGRITHRSVLDGAGDVQQILREFECLHRAVEAHADKVALAGSAGEMSAIIASGRLALIPGLDTGNETNGDPLVLAELHRLGLRKMAMTHEAATPFCGSNSSEPKTTPGLSQRGREMVAACNRLGVLIDVSHCSDITFWGCLEASKRPVIATHSGARSRPGLVRRNLSDEMLKALAKSGGMIGIGGATDAGSYQKLWDSGFYKGLTDVSSWMAQHHPDPWELADALRDKAKVEEAHRALGLPKELPGSENVHDLLNPQSTIDHLEYVGRLIGFDRVGIGTDLEMYGADYPWMLRGIAGGLLKLNYPHERIRNIFSANFLRYFEDAGRPA